MSMQKWILMTLPVDLYVNLQKKLKCGILMKIYLISKKRSCHLLRMMKRSWWLSFRTYHIHLILSCQRFLQMMWSCIMNKMKKKHWIELPMNQTKSTSLLLLDLSLKPSAWSIHTFFLQSIAQGSFEQGIHGISAWKKIHETAGNTNFKITKWEDPWINNFVYWHWLIYQKNTNISFNQFFQA